jgi:hypothetical protein
MSASVARALALAALKRQIYEAPTGNGIVINNRGQLVGRSIIPANPSIEIDNPDGRGGPIVIRAISSDVELTRVIGKDLNVTTDTLMQIKGRDKYAISTIIATNPRDPTTGALVVPTAAAGGVYMLPSKSGYNLVANTQVYTDLTDSELYIELTLTATAKRFLSGPNLYWSLTTANGAPCIADAYVFGRPFDGQLT